MSSANGNNKEQAPKGNQPLNGGDNKNIAEPNSNINNQEDSSIPKQGIDSPVGKKSENLFDLNIYSDFSTFVRENLSFTPQNLNINTNEGKLNRPPMLALFTDNEALKNKNSNGLDFLFQSVNQEFTELTNKGMSNISNFNNHLLGDFGLTQSLLVDPTGQSHQTFHDISNKFKDSTNLLNSSFIQHEYQKQMKERQEELIRIQEERMQQEKLKQEKLNAQKANSAATEGTECQNGENDSDNPNDNDQKIREGCRCKNSKCLKLYCECFAKGAYCRDICKCLLCSNKEEFESDIKEARKATLTRNPDAFTSKLEVVGTIGQDEDSDANNRGMLGYKKGCKCKKTFCKKKYCECYNAGVKCSYLCICENCHNQEDDPNSKEKDGNNATQEQATQKNPNYAGGTCGANHISTTTNNSNTTQDGKGGSDQSLEYNTQQFSTAKKKIKTNQYDEQDNTHQLSTEEKINFQFTPNFSIHDKSIDPNSIIKGIQYPDYNFNS